MSQDVVGPLIRFTPVQTQQLWASFIYGFINDETTINHKWVATWLYSGQRREDYAGGHTFYVKVWAMKRESAIILWRVISATLRNRLDLTKAQREAYLKRQRFIEEHLNINTLELMARI